MGALEVAQRIIDLIFVALAEVLPARVSAPSFATANTLALEGKASECGSYLFQTVLGGGYGGTSATDGLSNGSPLLSAARTASVELLEKRYPLLFQQYSLRDGSGGAGRYRGGLGVQYVFQLRSGTARLTLLGERVNTPPPGVRGGWKGKGGKIVLRIGNQPASLAYSAKGEVIALTAGDTVSIETPGGGGYGNPFARSIPLVTRDLKRAYLSRAEAKHKYGVVYPEGSLEFDSVRTSRIRGYILSFADDIYVEEIEEE
jgi:N-methylhydantoinase B